MSFWSVLTYLPLFEFSVIILGVRGSKALKGIHRMSSKTGVDAV